MPDRYRALIENMPDAFAYHRMIVDKSGNPVDCVFLDVNPAFEKMTGLQKEKVVGQRVTAIYPGIKEAKFDWIGTFGQVAATGEEIRFEQRFEPSGQTFAVTVYRQQPGYFAAIFREITGHKQLQTKIQTQRNKLTKLQDFQAEMLKTAVIWISIFDEQGNVLFWNKAAEEISGYTAAEAAGHARIWEWLYPAPGELTAVKNKIKRIIYQGENMENYETRIKRKGGQYRTMLWHANRLLENGSTALITIGADISERKEAELNLRKISTEYERVFQCTQNANYLIEVVGPATFRYLRANRAYEKATGFPLEFIKGKTPQELLGKSLGDQITRNCSKCLQAASLISYEETSEMPGGKQTWITTLTPICCPPGKIAYLVGSSQDITELREAENLLRVSEERYRLLVENANDAIVVIQAGYIKFANPKTLQLLACSLQEATTLPFNTFVHPDDWPLIRKRSHQRWKGAKLTQPFLFRIIARDGKIKHVSDSSVNIEWESRPALLTVMADITTMVKMEEEIFKADKLESIGILAGGIAHDFNNYLATLLANISLAKYYQNDTAKIAEKLENMEKAVQRAKDLSNQLFAFARGGALFREKIAIRQLILDNVKFALSGTPVSPCLDLPEDLAPVEADAGQLSQVLNNLVINAVQAMSGTGTLTVQAENVVLAAAGAGNAGGAGNAEFVGFGGDVGGDVGVDAGVDAGAVAAAVVEAAAETIVAAAAENGVDVEALSANLAEATAEKIVAAAARAAAAADVAETAAEVEAIFAVAAETAAETGDLPAPLANANTGAAAAKDVASSAFAKNDVAAVAAIAETAAAASPAPANTNVFAANNVYTASNAAETPGVFTAPLAHDAAEAADAGTETTPANNDPAATSPAPVNVNVNVNTKADTSAAAFEAKIFVENSVSTETATETAARTLVAAPVAGVNTVPLPAGPYVKITVCDEGAGIPKKFLQKIFDPFFTTKKKGRGLGLATSYAIIKKHGGHISVKSTAGIGTSFTIYLPAVPEEKITEAAGEDPCPGKGKILIMEDEEDLLNLTGDALTTLGYDVTLARNGQQALAFYTRALMQNQPFQPFNLVILNLTIPGGPGGQETLQELRKLDPAVKAVITSGYCNDPVLTNYRDRGFQGMLKKPFTLAELSKTVKEAIQPLK